MDHRNTIMQSTLLQVSWMSAVLGFLIGTGVLGWIIHPRLCPLFFYLAVVSLFHLLEFILIIVNQTRSKHSGKTDAFQMTKSLDAFLLSNGKEYLYSLILPALEFAFAIHFMPTYKSTFIFRMTRQIGYFAVLCGQFLRSWAIFSAGSAFSHHLAVEIPENQQLIKTGVYAHCRHPSYAGYFLWALGLQMVLGNIGCFAFFYIVLKQFFRDRIEEEERMLGAHYGREYEEYKTVTASGLPFIIK